MPTPGNRKADRFATLLEQPRETGDPAMAPYLALASALGTLAAPAGPSPEFRAALRQRVLAVATVQGIGEQPQGATARLREAGITWNFQRRTAIVAGTAAAAIAVVGVGVGASRSLPGDPFYGVKRATERVQLATTTGQEAKGKRHLEFASTRLREVEALVGQNSALSDFMPGTVGALGPMSQAAKSSTIVSTLQDMDSETRAGAQDLLAVAVDSGTAEPLRALNTFTRDQYVALRSVLPSLPLLSQPRAERSLSLLQVVSARTQATARIVTPAQPRSGPSTPSTPSSTGPTPRQSGTPRHHHGQGNSTSPATTPSTPSGPGVPTEAPTQLPSSVPTIPALPTVLPAPTSLPTSLPTLPDLGLPTLGH